MKRAEARQWLWDQARACARDRADCWRSVEAGKIVKSHLKRQYSFLTFNF